MALGKGEVWYSGLVTRNKDGRHCTELMNYLKAILDFGYFTFLIPFRLKFTPTGCIITKNNKIHTATAVFVQLLLLYETVSWMVFIWRHQILKTSYDYIVLSHIIGCFSFRLVCIRIFWFRMNVFKTLVEQLEKLEFLKYDQKRENASLFRKDILLPIVIFLWSVVDAIAELIAVNVGVVRQGFMGGKLKNLRKEAEFLYLFHPATDNSTLGYLQVTTPPTQASFPSVFFTFIHLLGILPHYVCITSLDKNVLLLTILAKRLTEEFVAFAKQCYNAKPQLVLEQYESLKSTFDILNNTFGLLFACLIGGCLPFYPTWGALVLFRESPVNKFQLTQFLIFFGTLVLLLYTAAGVTSKMQGFYADLSSICVQNRREEKYSNESLFSFMIDLQMNRVSLKGGHIFSFTFPFFRTIMSIMATYSVIIIQLELSRYLP